MPGYTIDLSECCCGSPCCNLCCPNGFADRLFAQLETDCGVYSTWLELVEYPCCDENGQPIKCDGGLPRINGACKEYIGRIDFFECPQLITAEGDYACLGTGFGTSMDIVVALMSLRPFACLHGLVQVTGFGSATYPLPEPLDCEAIDFTQDVTSTPGGDLILACDHGKNILTITG